MGLGNPPTTPNTFPDQNNPISLTGQIDSTTGAISGASLTFPPIPQPPTLGQNPTFTIGEVHPGTATGTFDSTTGAVTLNDALTITLTIEPIGFVCTTSPVNVALSGTWNSTTQDVTLATTSSFTIPQFSSASPCNSAATTPPLGTLNSSPGGVAGSVGNSLTVALSGKFAPGLPTTTTLAASPNSPQLTGSSVTLTATVADPSTQGTPSGNVTFDANGTSIGTGTLTASGTTGTATASLTTTKLAQTTNQLTAVYGGDSTYSGSTSTAVPYTIQPLPTITTTFPSQMTAGLSDFPAPTPFSVTVTNPVGGATYTNNLFLYVGLDNQSWGSTEWSYQDQAGNWCPLSMSVSGPGNVSGFTGAYLGGGAGPATCQFSPSFSLDPGQSMTVQLELAISQDPYETNPGYGPFQFGAALETGSCTSQASCTAVAPLAGSTAQTSVALSTLVNESAPGSVATVVTVGGFPLNTTMRSGYAMNLTSTVREDPNSSAYTTSFPTGTVQFFVDGTYAFTAPIPIDNSGDSSGDTNGVVYYPGVLAPGTHTVTANYSGDQTFAPSSVNKTFTVIAGPPPGAPYTCAVTPVQPGPASNFDAYVTAVSTGVPTTAVSGTSVTASNVSVTLDLDAASTSGLVSFLNEGDPQGAAMTFSPGATTVQAPSDATFTDPSPKTDFIGTWTGLSTTQVVTGSPGSTVPIGVSQISFAGGLALTVNCTPVSAPAAVGTVTISGTTLAVTPQDSAPVGAPVTMTATVAPLPPGFSYNPGQVDFFDGSTYLGTADVDQNTGTASLTTNSLSVGDHQLTATWSGYGNIAPNSSNTADYAVGTATTTSLASSANPANAAKSVTFTATVSPPVGALTQPTGNVSFTSDGNPISGCGNQPLSMASPPTATCTTSLGAGQSHSIVATYGGDGTYLGSASDPLTQTTLPGTNTTILSTKDPSPPGNVTFWSGVSPSSGKGATPTGTVAFNIDGATYKACSAQPLGSGGGASCTVSFKAGTSHKVFATYAGSASYSGSKSSTITQSVTGSKSSTTPKDTDGSATLASGKALTAGQSILTGSYKLAMQTDGNLVEYQGAKAIWASGTTGHSRAGVTMQKDGNLVIYAQGKAIWASKTAGHIGSHLTLQGSDGNVVIYTPSGHPVWATGT